MPQLDPPLPLSAIWSPLLGILAIIFNHPIRFHTPNDLGNWTARFDGTALIPTSVNVGPVVVSIDMALGPPDPGPNVVSYSPPPFDVASDTAVSVPAPAFTDFPLGP